MIFIFNDSFYRDTVGNVLLYKGLSKKDHQCAIVTYSMTPDLLNEHVRSGDVLVVNHTRGARNEGIVKEAHKIGAKVAVLYTEGRPNTAVQEKWLYEAPIADLYFTWSNRISKEVKHNLMVNTGNPRFDVYTTPNLIRDKQTTCALHGLPDDKSITLVFSSYPQAKFAGEKKNTFYQKDYADLKIPLGDAETYARNEYLEREEFLHHVRTIAREEGVVVVKPHPMEDSAWWEQEAERHGNFQVISQDFAPNLIAIADKIVNRWSCTTTIEGWLSDVPVESFGQPSVGEEGLARETWELNNEGTSIQRKRFIKSHIHPFKSAASKVVNRLAKLHGEQLTRPIDYTLQFLMAQRNPPVPQAGFHVGKETTPAKLREVIYGTI